MPDLDLTAEEAEELTDELAAALEEMMDCTCAEMAPLWAEATRDKRAYLDAHAETDLGFVPSARYRALSKGSRSKYRQLAAWRHAVIWRRTREQVPTDWRDAMVAVYFTPFPENAPPYAWSSRASGAPGALRFASASTLKEHAKEGCWWSVGVLRKHRHRLTEGGRWARELRAELLEPATGESLRDVLKLEDHPEWDLNDPKWEEGR